MDFRDCPVSILGHASERFSYPNERLSHMLDTVVPGDPDGWHFAKLQSKRTTPRGKGDK